MTAVTGLVDAVIFCPWQRLHCEHDGKHPASSVCDGARVWTFRGALVNGAHRVFLRRDTRRTDHVPRDRRFADPIRGTSIPARGDISLCGIVLQHRIQKRFAGSFPQTACSDRLHGAGHGHAECRRSEARNPGYDDDRLTLTVTGIAADSSLANGNNPRLARELVQSWQSFSARRRRSRHTLLDLSGARACDRNLRRLQRCVFRSLRTSG